MKQKYFSKAILTAMFLLILNTAFCEKIAIYNGTGVWQDGLTAIENMLDEFGIEYVEIDAASLNSSTENPLDNMTALWISGNSLITNYKNDIDSTGRTKIQNFVNDGGVYIGSGAGTYYACDYYRWNTVVIDDDLTLSLFNGYADGPETFLNPTYEMTTININTSHPSYNGGNASEDILLYQGGSLHGNIGAVYDIVGTFSNGQNAIITTNYGSGKVVLLSVHPEIEEDSDRDGVNFNSDEANLNDNGSDWDFMQKLLKWSFPKRAKKVAIYNDIEMDPINYGAWAEGVMAYHNMLDGIGIANGEVTPTQLNNPNINPLNNYDAIWFPGGWAYYYKFYLTAFGKQRIREFVNQGGVYLGTCAGSYFGCEYYIWEDVTYDDYANYLNLFDGVAIGPELFEWPNYGVVTVNMNMSHPANYNGNSTEDILLYGGGKLIPNEGASYDIIGTYAHNGEIAMLSTDYGNGKVILTAVHPEIEEDSDRDGFNFDR